MAENKKTAAKSAAAKQKTRAAAEAADETKTGAGVDVSADEIEQLLADAVPEYDENTSVETLLAIAAQVGLDGAEDTVKAYLVKLLDIFFDGMTGGGLSTSGSVC